MCCTFPSCPRDVSKDRSPTKHGDTLKHFLMGPKHSQGAEKYPPEAADKWLLEGWAGAGGLVAWVEL